MSWGEEMQSQQLMELILAGFDHYAAGLWLALLVLLLCMLRARYTLRRELGRQRQSQAQSLERLTQVELELAQLKNRLRAGITPPRNATEARLKKTKTAALLPSGPEPVSWNHGEAADSAKQPAVSDSRTLDCRNCGQQIRYLSTHAGRQLKCSSCRVTVKLT